MVEVEGMFREVQGLLLDIDGVLTVSWRPLPGAPRALARIRAAGLPFRLLTNTTELTRRALVSTLREAGFDVAPEDIVTALVATGQFLRSHFPGSRCFVIGGADSLEDLDGVAVVRTPGEADVVVVGGSGEPIARELGTAALRLVLAGAPLVAMHGSLTWMTEEGLLLDTGRALVLALEEASGRRATIVGKPSSEFFREALDILGLPASTVAMVGDDLETDVLAAQELGMTGVLVRTGKFSPNQLDRWEQAPDRVIGSVAELPGLLGLE